MKVLVINCGSSSLKYQLINMEDESVLAIGLVERIGIEGSVLKHEVPGNDKVVIEVPMPDHKAALEQVMAALVDANHGAIKSMDEINAVGHRVVHGGEKFASSVIIDDKVMAAIEEMCELAPLHNPPNLIGINACRELLPSVPMVAVFDTAFHQTMPEEAYIYAIPYEYYEKFGVRRYGFHGTSHKYVSERCASLMGKDIKDLRIITCHLGNGASVAAIDHGKVVDTSMGFTPLEGLMMGTRSGDMDPAITTFLMQKLDLDCLQINDILNKKSGVLGISGVSSDFRDIEKAAGEGNHRAQLALDCYYQRVKKYIGSYMTLMGGVDAIVFTAGLGENSIESRKIICSGMEDLGIKIDDERNNVRGKETLISAAGAKVSVFCIPTNEELVIARDTKELV